MDDSGFKALIECGLTGLDGNRLLADGISFICPTATALAYLRFSRFAYEWANHAYFRIKERATNPGWPSGETTLPNSLNYVNTLAIW